MFLAIAYDLGFPCCFLIVARDRSVIIRMLSHRSMPVVRQRWVFRQG